MITYLLWLGRDMEETWGDWLLAVALDLAVVAWVVVLIAAAAWWVS